MFCRSSDGFSVLSNYSSRLQVPFVNPSLLLRYKGWRKKKTKKTYSEKYHRKCVKTEN